MLHICAVDKLATSPPRVEPSFCTLLQKCNVMLTLLLNVTTSL